MRRQQQQQHLSSSPSSILLLPYTYAVRERITRHADAIASTISSTLNTLTLTLPGPPSLQIPQPFAGTNGAYSSSTSSSSSTSAGDPLALTPLDLNGGFGGGGGSLYVAQGLLTSNTLSPPYPCPTFPSPGPGTVRPR